MERESEPAAQVSSSIGWRLKTLRERRGMRQSEVAARAGLQASYLSRVENGLVEPGLSNIDRMLVALGATSAEANAVLHREEPPLTPREMAEQIGAFAPLVEIDPVPTGLFDNRGYRLYANRGLRAMLGLAEDEYRRLLGEHLILSVIDPDSAVYNRFAEDRRVKDFLVRASTFKSLYADQEFDSWYLEISRRVGAIPWARELWNGPPVAAVSIFAESYSWDVVNPLVGQLRFTGQFNHLATDTRFLVLRATPRDEESAQKLRHLRAMPEFAYAPDPPGLSAR